MATKRQVISNFRDMIKERNADSVYSNQFLYNTLFDQAKWLIKREISAGRIYKNTFFFQTLGCQEVIEVDAVTDCCPINTGCKMYRTKNKVAETWIDNNGPVIKSVTSIDGSTKFEATSSSDWLNISKNPYKKYSKEVYYFYSDGYLWFPEKNPNLINIYAFFTDDISELSCNKEKKCISYLDTIFPVPDWIESEMYAKALQLLFPSIQKPEDQKINKNTNRK